MDESFEIQLYPAIASPELPFDTDDSVCLEYCGQIIHPDLVGVEVQKLNGSQSTRCNCLFSGDVPEDIQLSNYDPVAAFIFDSANHSNSGPVAGSEGSVGVWCYAISTPPATTSPTVSPTAEVRPPRNAFNKLVQASVSMNSGKAMRAFRVLLNPSILRTRFAFSTVIK